MNSQRAKSSKGKKRQKKTKEPNPDLPATAKEDPTPSQDDKVFLTGINIDTENKELAKVEPTDQPEPNNEKL